jgi:hypothetical protein
MLFQQLCKPIIREVFQDPFDTPVRGTELIKIEVEKNNRNGTVVCHSGNKILAFLRDFGQFTSRIWGGLMLNPTSWVLENKYIFFLDNGKVFEGEYSNYEIVDVEDFATQDKYGDQVLAAKDAFTDDWIILLDNGSTVEDGDSSYDKLTAKL